MKKIIPILALLSASISIPVRAQWAPNGTGVCLLPQNQINAAAVPDGVGGVIVVWEDHRYYAASGSHTYAQRLDADGTPVWYSSGVRMCTFPLSELHPGVAPDGAGGAIVAWSDPRAGRSYGQRIDASGSLLWGDQGLQLCTASGSREVADVLSDGAGGAIVVWLDERSPPYDVFAQRVSGNGSLLWGGGGVSICASEGVQHSIHAVADGAGGAVVSWTDERNLYPDIYVQRVNASGSPLWTADGVPVCTAQGAQGSSTMVSDGNGGATVAWADNREGGDGDIYAQRISTDGTPRWTTNGVPVCTAGYGQGEPVMISDGGGGAIIGWEDGRVEVGTDLYAQRLNGEGSPLWAYNGVPLCAVAGFQAGLGMVALPARRHWKQCPSRSTPPIHLVQPPRSI